MSSIKLPPLFSSRDSLSSSVDLEAPLEKLPSLTDFVLPPFESELDKIDLTSLTHSSPLSARDSSSAPASRQGPRLAPRFLTHRSKSESRLERLLLGVIEEKNEDLEDEFTVENETNTNTNEEKDNLSRRENITTEEKKEQLDSPLPQMQIDGEILMGDDDDNNNDNIKENDDSFQYEENVQTNARSPSPLNITQHNKTSSLSPIHSNNGKNFAHSTQYARLSTLGVDEFKNQILPFTDPINPQTINFIEELYNNINTSQVSKNQSSFRSGISLAPVEVVEFFRIVKQKEGQCKLYTTLVANHKQKEWELKHVLSTNEFLSKRLEELEIELQDYFKKTNEVKQLKERVWGLEARHASEVEIHAAVLAQRLELEAGLDGIAAELGTLTSVKKAIQLKLFQASEERNVVAKAKRSLEEGVEVEKQSYLMTIAELVRSNTRLDEALGRAVAKLEQLNANEKNLESQLAKAREQVVHLIEQIGLKEAQEAREAKAEKAAREAELRAKGKPRYPTGQVALVFTDVQGSTAQWELHADAMGVALEMHNNILRQKLLMTGGYEVRTEGDSFFVAFHTPLSAVWWCLFSQQALLEADWPAKLLTSPHAQEERIDETGALLWRGLRVRMGIHLGKPQCQMDPVSGRMDYFGIAVNRAARISSMAHGGQIIIGGDVWKAVHKDLGGNVHVVPLGEYHLKGMMGTEQLFQILPAGLAKRKFPTLKTEKPIPHPHGGSHHEHQTSEGNIDHEVVDERNNNDDLALPRTATIKDKRSTSSISLARLYQQREEEEEGKGLVNNNNPNNNSNVIVDSEMDNNTQEKLQHLYKELTSTLKNQEEEKKKANESKLKETMKKQIKELKNQIASVQASLSQISSERDLLQYQSEKFNERLAESEMKLNIVKSERNSFDTLFKEIEEGDNNQQSHEVKFLKGVANFLHVLTKQQIMCLITSMFKEETKLYSRQTQEIDTFLSSFGSAYNSNYSTPSTPTTPTKRSDKSAKEKISLIEQESKALVVNQIVERIHLLEPSLRLLQDERELLTNGLSGVSNKLDTLNLTQRNSIINNLNLSSLINNNSNTNQNATNTNSTTPTSGNTPKGNSRVLTSNTAILQAILGPLLYSAPSTNSTTDMIDRAMNTTPLPSNIPQELSSLSLRLYSLLQQLQIAEKQKEDVVKEIRTLDQVFQNTVTSPQKTPTINTNNSALTQLLTSTHIPTPNSHSVTTPVILAKRNKLLELMVNLEQDDRDRLLRVVGRVKGEHLAEKAGAEIAIDQARVTVSKMESIRKALEAQLMEVVSSVLNNTNTNNNNNNNNNGDSEKDVTNMITEW